VTHEEAFLLAILEDLKDDTPRLVYSDWLEEQGDTIRAEFIRMQCARGRLLLEDPQRVVLYRREEQFLMRHGEGWLEPLRLHRGIGAWHFRRGFLEHANLPASAFRVHHQLLFRIAALHLLWFEQEHDGTTLAPLRGADEVARLLAASPLLIRLGSLRFPRGDLSSAGAIALAESRSLGRLNSLDLAGNRVGRLGARALAAAPHWPQLAFLNLYDNSLGDSGATALAEGPHLTHLVSLSLDDNAISDSGARALAASARLAGLVSLHLADNRLGPAGVRALAQSRHLTRLGTLRLDNNSLGDAGARELLAGPWPQLRLSVRGCGISSAVFGELSERFGQGVVS
jgi:uncharacterized protein (TIGR02996 family)